MPSSVGESVTPAHPEVLASGLELGGFSHRVLLSSQALLQMGTKIGELKPSTDYCLSRGSRGPMAGAKVPHTGQGEIFLKWSMSPNGN